MRLFYSHTGVRLSFDIIKKYGTVLNESSFLSGENMNIYVQRRKYLEELGFSEKAISRLEAVTPKLFTKEYVDSKLAGLHARGFTDPMKILKSLPAILNLSFNNIDAKLAGLQARGFTNPTKLVISNPQILVLSLHNIDTKLRHARRLQSVVMPCREQLPAFLRYSSKRIRLCVRIACNVVDADFLFFAHLIKKDVLRMTAAVISLETLTKRAVMQAYRRQKNTPEENRLHVLNSSDKIALAYKQYCTL